jgi:acyl-CoA synthetase (AMP-forming)/AMP-acid ligase II
MASPHTLTSAFQHAARGTRGVVFVDRHEVERRVSYRELCASARGVAAALRNGLASGPGVPIALALRTSPEFYDAFFGVLLAGAVPVVIPPPALIGVAADFAMRTAGMLRRAEAVCLLTHDRLLSAMTPIAAEAGVAHVVGVESLREQAEPTIDAEPDADADAVALIQFSSGSGDEPKAIRLTHRQILANVDAILAALSAARGDGAGVSWLPLHHDMGLVGCLLTAVRAAADLVLLAPDTFVARPALWLRAIARHRASVSPAPSFGYAFAVDQFRDDELAGVDLSCWRDALNGGEPVSAIAMGRFLERFAPFGFRREAFRPVYGLAEATLAVCFPPSGRAPLVRRFDAPALATGRAVPTPNGAPIVSVGQPLPGYELRIVSDDDRAVSDGSVGAIFVRGPSLMTGDDWLDTGDRGFILDGEVFIHGRAKDVIIVNGLKFAPERIEAAADQVTGRLGSSVAIGIARDEEVLAVLIERARPGSAPARWDDETVAAAVKTRVGERVALTPAVVLMVPPGSLPRTTSGKIQRGEVRRQYAAGHFRP